MQQSQGRARVSGHHHLTVAMAFLLEVSPACNSSPVSVIGIKGFAGGPRFTLEGEMGCAGAPKPCPPLALPLVLCAKGGGILVEDMRKKQTDDFSMTQTPQD